LKKIMTRIEFLQKQIEDVERKVIKELEGEYAQTGLEKEISE